MMISIKEVCDIAISEHTKKYSYPVTHIFMSGKIFWLINHELAEADGEHYVKDGRKKSLVYRGVQIESRRDMPGDKIFAQNGKYGSFVIVSTLDGLVEELLSDGKTVPSEWNHKWKQPVNPPVEWFEGVKEEFNFMEELKKL